MSDQPAAKKPRRGRPPRGEDIHHIFLRESTFKLWNERKEAMGWKERTHNEFAELLLHQAPSRMLELATGRNVDCRRPLFESTPNSEAKQRGIALPLDISVSQESIVVDVTGTSSHQEDASEIPWEKGNKSLSEIISSTINPSFASVPGDPFSCSDDSSDSSFENSCTSESSLSDSEDAESLSAREEEGDILESDTCSEPDDSATLTAIYQESSAEEDEVDSNLPQCHADESSGEAEKTLEENIKVTLQSLSVVPQALSAFDLLYRKERVVVEMDKLCEVFEGGCHIKDCPGKMSIVSKTVEGGVLQISWRCSMGHAGLWESSSVLGSRGRQKVYSSTVLMASAVTATGNNFEKVSLMMKFLNLKFVSEATFHRVQSFNLVPAVNELWGRMREALWDLLGGEGIVLCGDGRNDSPGHSAKYCVYSLMEHFMHIIVDVEVVDKRESGGVSTTMERLGLKRLLLRIKEKLQVKELVTDASQMIIALVRNLKGSPN